MSYSKPYTLSKSGDDYSFGKVKLCQKSDSSVCTIGAKEDKLLYCFHSETFSLKVGSSEMGTSFTIQEERASYTPSRVQNFSISAPLAQAFREQLDKFLESSFLLEGPLNVHAPEAEVGDGGRRFILGLKDSTTGRRFTVNEMAKRTVSNPWSGFSIPSQDITKLTEVLDKSFCMLDIAGNFKTLTVGNKRISFDLGQDKEGRFIKISEMGTKYEATVTLPEQCWHAFHDITGRCFPATTEEEDFPREQHADKAESSNSNKGMGTDDDFSTSRARTKEWVMSMKSLQSIPPCPKNQESDESDENPKHEYPDSPEYKPSSCSDYHNPPLGVDKELDYYCYGSPKHY